MADALCGPSNPLQTFQKTASADRTLQQDRLRSRLNPSGAQGFRSHDPRAGSLDAEFAAFEAGQPLDHTLNQFAPNPPSVYQPRFAPPKSDSSSWATDFQRLRLNSPVTSQSPISQHQFRPEAPLQRSGPVAGWHSEFMTHGQPNSKGKQAIDTSVQTSLPQTNSLSMGPGSYMGFPNQGIYQSQDQYPQLSSPQDLQFQSEHFDEAAFEAAFAHAASSELQPDERGQEIMSDKLEMSDVENIQNAFQADLGKIEPETIPDLHPTRDQPLELDDAKKLGSDRIPAAQKHEVKDEAQQQQDEDDLARTAGALLYSVKDDQSEKFQQSEFLALMRRLRDREAVVMGDDIVDNSAARAEVGQPSFDLPGGIL